MDPRIPTAHRVSYALGYLALGLSCEAAEELAAIAPRDQASQPVVTVWVEVNMERQRWLEVIGHARQLAAIAPAQERGWIAWAYALRELQRTEEAREVLLKAEPLHGDECALLHFNLACYESLLGRFAEARRRLALAFEIDPSYRAEAETDPDLQPLREAGGWA